MILKRLEQKMFLIERKFLLPAALLAVVLLLSLLPGCGLRQSQTGSLSSRIIDADGNAVVNATVFSIFAETEKVYSKTDGAFYLSELPAGLNNIVITHPDYALEERQVEIKTDGATVVDFIKLDRANAPNRISDVRVASVASSSAVVTWNTYRSVICNIDYGKTTAYGQIYREERQATEHSAIISALEPETIYHFRVQYIGDNATTYYSYDFSFRTESADRPAAPAGIKILPLASLNIVSLEWQAATGPSVKGYNVYRSDSYGSWIKLNDTVLGVNVRNYSDQTVEAGLFCRYAVTAANDYAAESEKTVSETLFVPGIITRNVQIKTSDSPVRVYADLIIAAGSHFEVEAGTEFLISGSDAFASGLDEDRVEIVAHGRLALSGSAAAPVSFAPLDGSGRRDHWAGIRILSHLTGISQLDYVKLFGCSGYAVDVTAERVKIAGITISYCNSGLSLDGLVDFLELDSCTFNEISQVAVNVNKCRRVQISNTVFSGVGQAISNFTDDAEDQLIVKKSQLNCLNTGIAGTFGKLKFLNLLLIVPDGTGMSFDAALHNRENYVDHCTIEALNGIVVKSGEFIIENNIINNRGLKGQTGINNTSVLTPDYAFNNIYGFKDAYVSCGGGTGALQIEPKFVGGNPYSYALQPDSTLRLQDRYGSEMGFYGATRF